MTRSGASAWRMSRPDVPRIMEVRRDGPLAELLGQGDDDPRGTAEVAEPVAVLVLRHLTEELSTVGAQASHDVVDVVDGEHDPMQTQRVGRRVLRLGADYRWAVVHRQLQLAVAVGGAQHRDG